MQYITDYQQAEQYRTQIQKKFGNAEKAYLEADAKLRLLEANHDRLFSSLFLQHKQELSKTTATELKHYTNSDPTGELDISQMGIYECRMERAKHKSEMDFYKFELSAIEQCVSRINRAKD